MDAGRALLPVWLAAALLAPRLAAADDAPAGDATPPAEDAPTGDAPTGGGEASPDAPDPDEQDLGADEAADSLRATQPVATWDPAFRPYLAAGLGLALPLGALGLSPTASLELGAELPWLGGRLLPALGVSGLMPAVQGTVTDANATSLDWRFQERQVAVQPALRVRLAPPAGRLQAELKAGGGLALGVNTMAVGDPAAPLSLVSEDLRSWAAHAGAAAGGRVRRALVLGEVYWTGHRLDSSLAGTAFPSHLVVAVGVRHDV